MELLGTLAYKMVFNPVNAFKVLNAIREKDVCETYSVVSENITGK